MVRGEWLDSQPEWAVTSDFLAGLSFLANGAGWESYLRHFRTIAGRERMADRFKAQADQLGLEIEVLYT